MNVEKTPIKYRVWASALAVSLCLVSTTGCSPSEKVSQEDIGTGDSSVQTVQPESNETTDPESDRESVDVLSEEEIEKISSAHNEYSTSISTNFISPLNDIKEKINNSEAITQVFIEEKGFNPSAVKQSLDELISSVDGPIGELKENALDGSDNEIVDALNSIKTAASSIRSNIVIPLVAEENNYSEDNIISALGEGDPVNGDGPIIIGQIFNNIATAADPSQSETSLSPQKYGPAVYTEIEGFFNSQNNLILAGVNTISGSTMSPDSLADRVLTLERRIEERGQNWLSVLALFLGIVNTVGLGFLIYLLRAKRDTERRTPKLSEQSAKKRSSSTTNGSFEDLSRIVQQQENKIESLQRTCTALSQDMSQLAQKSDSASTQVHAPITEHRDPHRPISAPQTATDTFATFSRDRSQHTAPREQPKAFHPPTSATAYNQNPNLFRRIDTVALSQTSQEDLRAGKNVIPTFSPLSQGDYWIVTEDNKTFYLVVKDRAILNKNNLETLQIIYAFDNQPSLSSKKRRYKRLSEVTRQSGTDWTLRQRGDLVFY